MKTLKSSFFIFGSILLILTGFTITNPFKTPYSMQPIDNDKPYEELWETVDSLDDEGLPKSALEVVNTIRTKALNESNYDQFLKAVIHQYKYRSALEENAYEKFLIESEEEIEKMPFPANAMMQSMLAEMYWWYYQSNRWKFHNRTATVNFDPQDIATWDLNRIVDKVIHLYNASLREKEKLQESDAEMFKELIYDGSKPDEFRPTLYDFLAHRAIDFFMNSEISLSRPADQFALKQAYYFAPAGDFINQNIETEDTLSLHFHAIKQFQNLLLFRINRDNNPEALLDAELKRIGFVYNHSVHPLKDSLYLDYLEKTIKKYAEIPYSGEFSYLIAKYYYDKSGNYNPIVPQTKQYETYLKKAHTLCGQIIHQFSKTNAADKCKSLQFNIENGSLSFETEKPEMPDQHFPIRIDYKNIDSIHIRIASIDPKKKEKIYEKHYKGDYHSNREKRYFDDIKKASSKIYIKSIELPVDNDFNSHSVEELIAPLPLGHYVIMVANNPKFTYKKNIVAYDFINITDLTFMERTRKNGTVDVYVISRKTSKPLQNVKVTAWYNDWNSLLRKYQRKEYGVFRTNQNGHVAIVPESGSYSKSCYIDLETNKDFYSNGSSHYLYKRTPYDPMRTQTTIFTDRAIYRPGQTIYFKGIILSKNKEEAKILPKFSQTVILYDVNRQKVSELQVVSNEYGTFSGSFSIPKGLLNGQFQIYTGTGIKYISVEEYKRPKFEAEILPFDGNYLLGDTVTVKGKAIAYAGPNITDAKVKYRVVRNAIWSGWWWWDFNASTTEITNGVVTTDEKGEFSIDFKAIPDLSLAKSEFLMFNYTIHADVTDLNGETQSASKSITIGYKTLNVNIEIPIEIDKNDEQEYTQEGVKINTRNLNGEFIPAQGSIKIYELKEPPVALRNKEWKHTDKHLYTKEEWYKLFPGNEYTDENQGTNLPKGKLILQENFNTAENKKLKLKGFKNWSSGRYVIEIASKDIFGNPVQNKEFFTVYDSKDSKVPFAEIDWYSVVENTGEPGDKAKLLIGSVRENVKVLYEVEHKSKIVETKWLDISNEQKLIEIPIEEKHRGNFAVHFAFVYQNRFYRHDEIIYVPYTNKQLDIEFATFRDKLQPGEEEQWIIKVKGKNGDKVAAEMVATLYDASLDQFRRNSWNFDIYTRYYSELGWSSNCYGKVNSDALHYDYHKSHGYRTYSYDYLNWFGFSYYSSNRYYSRLMGATTAKSSRRRTSKLKKMAMPKSDARKEAADMLMDAPETEEEMIIEDSSRPSVPQKSKKRNGDGEDNGGGEDFGDVKVRTNFNETAFFMPQLETDEDGNILIKFTIPESLTRWRMMGFAHTKDLKSGFVYNELVTQKTLMLMPNPPRFFREDDQIVFPAKISNLAEEALTGKVKLELFDAITMQSLNDHKAFKNLQFTKDFTVEAQQNTMVDWQLNIPSGIGAITYRLVAKAGKFSDGEEKPIPVLTNRMLVTEALPLPVRSHQTKQFEFTKLINSGQSSTLRHHKLTLEYTSNPAWYAVQALPYLMEYPYECTEQTFSRYYANSLASHIANSSPKIKRVFDSWRNLPDSKALLSNLEKNEELKYLLLQETPWVLQAQDENERKHRIALLFDLNRMANELNAAMKKLQKAQAANGGWPWFKGMPESWYITQHIVCGMGHLDHLGVKNVRDDTKTWSMVKNAVGFIDHEIVDAYKNVQRSCKYLCRDSKKKNCYEKCMEDDHLSYMAIHYLYARSYFTDIPIPRRSKEAFEYFKKQAVEYWLNKGIYSEGMIALALHRFEEERTPKKIIKSLKEHSIEHDELGMYWKSNSGGYYWYQAPIETQALLIETFDEVAGDQKSVDAMKVWLLKQKQTQDWKTTKATVEAIYALLLKGTDWLASDEMVKIKVGDMDIDPKKMPDVKVEAGTGYFKTSWGKGEIKPEMGRITVTKTNEGVSWGAMYWQYFEQLDKITPHETPLKLNKKLFVERDTKSGKIMEPIGDKAKLKVGDKIIVRIELRVDRDMEYVHMKDMRASGFEPINVISRCKYQDGLYYYESTKDAATNFFMSYLPKGTYVFEYPLWVSHKGDFSNGITSIQCMYAPEFGSHSEGIRVQVD